MIIASDNNILTMSIFNYLTSVEGYTNKSFLIEYPAFEKDRYMALFRLQVQPFTGHSVIFIKINSTQDSYILNLFRIKLIEVMEEPMLKDKEGVNYNLSE